MEKSSRQTLGQFVRFALVGGMNTGVTLGVIFLLNGVLGISLYTANITGYTAGLINSFLIKLFAFG